MYLPSLSVGAVVECLPHLQVVLAASRPCIIPPSPGWRAADAREEANQDEAYSETAWADGLKAFSESMLDSGRKGLPADRIAHIVASALTTPRPKARYAPVPDKLTNFTLPLLLPKRVVDRVFGKRLGLVRK